ncbi:type IV pilus twitching motility protein PilT [Calothrix sp. NIES-3974]|uniref:type IV pilus twitching motility protein PilT n=1 Tax=Calothrix sp. NIES-3974 TaxID=2005462 RepID=UPI000B5F3A6A|nr:PilT/PilU family type 4a pilus ATPase [Calothrix sp. NIES-3974]BAZ03971.1 twitching motility protein [Calothrix sp. NIES-3974]
MEEPLASPLSNPNLPHLPSSSSHSFGNGRLEMVTNNTMTIQQMVRDAHTQQASDIHIRVGEVPRFRVRGQILVYQKGEIVTPQDFEAYLMELLTPSQRSRFLETKELDTGIFYPGFVRCRVNCFETLTGGAMVLRLINLEVPSIESLRLPAVLKDIVSQKQGLVLVTGATNSGKTTTIAAMIRFLNENFQKHIVTIEDPIEYVHTSRKSLVTQREVGLHTQAYHDALRSVLREDPDVIIIGEIRDRLTIDTAIKAAQTGHLVIGTLHTKNSLVAIDRLLSQYHPEEQAMMRVQIVDTLVAVITQQLVPSTDGRRVAALEILLNNPTMQDYLLKGEDKAIWQLMESSTHEGMQLMNYALCALMRSGKISIEEAINASPDVADLRRRTRNDAINPLPITQRAICREV